jgi:hypothetical protein
MWNWIKKLLRIESKKPESDPVAIAEMSEWFCGMLEMTRRPQLSSERLDEDFLFVCPLFPVEQLTPDELDLFETISIHYPYTGHMRGTYERDNAAAKRVSIKAIDQYKRNQLLEKIHKFMEKIEREYPQTKPRQAAKQ